MTNSIGGALGIGISLAMFGQVLNSSGIIPKRRKNKNKDLWRGYGKNF
jgi:hypothetical protein